MAGGTAAGVVTGPASTLAEIDELVARADTAARTASPAEDANDIVVGAEAPDWDATPGTTSIAVFDTFAAGLGDVLERARLESRLLYGYVEHAVETTYLATSAGLRLRHEQPAGNIGITGKANRPVDVGLGRPADRRLLRRRRARARCGAGQADRLGRSRRGPTSRSVRDAAPADRGGGPVDLRLLRLQRSRRARRPNRVQRSWRRHQGRPADRPARRPAVLGPIARRARCHPVRRRPGQ